MLLSFSQARLSSESSQANRDIWVIVPAFNEAQRLDRTLCELLRECPNVVVVDDGSTDATHSVCSSHPVWYLRHRFNCGQGAALQTGIEFALQRGAQILVTFDADGQHCASDIPKLVAPLRSGAAEVSLGSRFLGEAKGLPRTRRWVLKFATVFTRLVSRVKVTDAHNGLRALTRSAADRIRLRQHGMAHASEIIDQIRQHDLRYCETPVKVLYNAETLEKGQSCWNSFRIVSDLLMGRLAL
jgi:glycosyltransferase involved in cell wall biosynthesis